MITSTNRKISIIAYFISKYDKEAINALGYETYTNAFEDISAHFDKRNNYMKLRRDEFDAIVSNTRQGWNKRNPSPAVMLLHNELNGFSFDELKEIVVKLIDDTTVKDTDVILTAEEKKIISNYDEEEFERIINAKDTSSRIIKRNSLISARMYNRTIPERLKKLYNCRCQICGRTAMTLYGIDISEAHHLEYFTKSANNDSQNIIIVCPDHHRIIHKADGVFDVLTHTFTYSNMRTESLLLNFHL